MKLIYVVLVLLLSTSAFSQSFGSRVSIASEDTLDSASIYQQLYTLCANTIPDENHSASIDILSEKVFDPKVDGFGFVDFGGIKTEAEALCIISKKTLSDKLDSFLSNY